MQLSKRQSRKRIQQRIRKKIKGTADRPRLVEQQSPQLLQEKHQ